MAYPDGVYLLKRGGYSSEGEPINNRFICYARNGYRSSATSIDKPIKEIYMRKRPYIPMEETARICQLIYVGTEDFINGMGLVDPDMTTKELLQALDINYEFEE